jgi:hypothetical protein
MIQKTTIEEIKRVHSEGMPISIISWKYNTSPGIVKEIVTGRYERKQKKR